MQCSMGNLEVAFLQSHSPHERALKRARSFYRKQLGESSCCGKLPHSQRQASPAVCDKGGLWQMFRDTFSLSHAPNRCVYQEKCPNISWNDDGTVTGFGCSSCCIKKIGNLLDARHSHMKCFLMAPNTRYVRGQAFSGLPVNPLKNPTVRVPSA